MYTRKGHMFQKGGQTSASIAPSYTNIILTGETDLITALKELQAQLDIGQISQTGESSMSVINYLSSPGYAQIQAVQKHLSSLMTEGNTLDNTLFSQILLANGYNSISEYTEDYSKAIKDLYDVTSTAKGLKELNDVNSGIVLQTSDWQVKVANIDYASQVATYQLEQDIQSTLSSQYISTNSTYQIALEKYTTASTIEYMSISAMLPQYSNLMNAHWCSLQDVIGTHWIVDSSSGGGTSTLENILENYSSLQLEDNILYNTSKVNFCSSIIATTSSNLEEYQGQLADFITCDYSTLVSTYIPNIMLYQTEILQYTSGDLYTNMSTLIGYSTLWISSLQSDATASTMYTISTGTYTYYNGLMNALSANIAALSTIYKSTLTSFKSWETVVCTNQTMVQFLELELGEMNAMSLFDSTTTIKSELQSMINLINSGQNVDDYFASVQGAFASLQHGGATSLQDVQLMYSTVVLMNNNYSTIYASTTAARAAAALPPNITQIYSDSLTTVFGIDNAIIAQAKSTYELNSLSSVSLTQQISSKIAYLIQYSTTSTITDDDIRNMYNDEWRAYERDIQSLIQAEYSTQQAIYQCMQSGLISSVIADTTYNSLEQIILRLKELGYQVNTGQQGGNISSAFSVNDFIQNDTAELENNIKSGITHINSVSSIQLTYIPSQQNGLIGAATVAASTASKTYSQIEQAILELQNATTLINTISSGAFVTTYDAITRLNTNSEKYYEYSHYVFESMYSTSYLNYKNYLTSLNTFSSFLTANLLENRDEITQLQWISSFPGEVGPTNTTLINTVSSQTIDYNSRISVLSTNSQNIRNYRPILQSFVNVILAEEYSRFYYLVVKSTFERQEYYRLKRGGTFTDMMSAYDFDKLTMAYDISVQNVNRYIAYKTNMFVPFLNATNKLIGVPPTSMGSIRQDIYGSLTANSLSVLPPPTYNITSSLKMEFATIPPRTIFPTSGIPTTTLMDCPSTVGSDPSAVQRTTYPAEPTTTLPTAVYGIQGRYVKISRADGIFNILQVSVIDSLGRNVAFGKPVTGLSGAPSAAAIVNGQYTDSSTSFTWTAPPSMNQPFFQIDLGATYDITCIRYSKPKSSQYNSVGLTFDIMNSSNTRVGGGTLKAGTPVEDMDLRTAGLASKASMYAIYSRTGACGYFGQYVRITQPTGGSFKLSQIAVVSLKGENVALNAGATYYNSSGTATSLDLSLLTDGNYYSRPSATCFVGSATSDAYIQVDLGSEKEVVAVHLYGANDTVSPNLKGIVATLYTNDRQIAYQQTSSVDSLKNILDFRYQDQATLNAYILQNQAPPTTMCSTELLWPAYYGEAGIICRYIAITKTTAGLGFTKIKVVDKSGRDVTLFKPVSVSSEAITNSHYYAVSDYTEPKPSSMSFVSATSDNSPYYIVDLERIYEVCSIVLYKCSDGDSLGNNIQIRLYGTDVAAGPITTFAVSNSQTATFDTRYDPDGAGHKYSADSLTTMKSYGRFGTLALSVEIQSYTSTMNITEGTGQNLYPTSIVIPNVPNYTMATVSDIISYTSSLTSVKFKNLREVNSVIVESAPIGTRVILRDCDGLIVNNKPIQYFSTETGVHKLADFRNPYTMSLASFAPMAPLIYDTFESASATLQAVYDHVANPEGIAVRYVKVSPPASGVPLSISQILVVDSQGINVAFQADTFTTDPMNVNKAYLAVDGEYEMNLDIPNYVPSVLSYENYRNRDLNQSFQTRQGGNYYWVVDLGKEYLVNSVVFVAAKGYGTASQNAVVEMWNAQLQRVAVQLVSSYVSIFGVDILDFRVDRAAPVSMDGACLEVRPRQIVAGCTTCGIMANFIRVEATNLRLSQIIVMDPYGNNIALYMPTYSKLNTPKSYKVVDGKYYMKMEQPLQGTTDAYISLPTATGELDFVEINFGRELEVVSVFIIPTMESPDFTTSGLVVKLYNKYRDVIAKLNPSSGFEPMSVSMANQAGIVFPSASKIIGVSILKKYANFLVAAGQMAGTVATGDPTPLGVSCDSNNFMAITCAVTPTLRTTPLFTRGANGGIPVRYVRVYNVDQYVQISQIMVYGFDGTNYAYQKPATSESIFPGTYPAKVTDGFGGYFHTARTWDKSYRSAGDRYGFIEIDLGSTKEIVGLRCIFPSDDQGQNISTRIYILDESSKVLAQYVVGSNVSAYNPDKYEFQEAIVDYRIQPQSIPITSIIMPKIYSVPRLIDMKGPNGILELGGNLYVADTIANKIWKNGAALVTGGLISRPVGLVTDETNLYVASYGNNSIVKVTLAGTPTTLFTVANLAPYGLCFKNGKLYTMTYKATSTAFYAYNISTATYSSYTLSNSINYPNSIAYIQISGSADFLLICSAKDKCIYKTEITGGATTIWASATGQIKLALVAPSAIFYDPNTYILFISDFTQDIVYSVNLLTDEVTRIAGVGKGGYKGDEAQGSLALLDGPMNLFYSATSGFLYISDYNNKAVRYLNLYSAQAINIAATTTSPLWPSWSTTMLAHIESNQSTLSTTIYTAPIPIVSSIQQIVSPAMITSVGSAISGIIAFYTIANTKYYAVGGTLYTTASPTPVFTIPGGGHISCITMNQGLLYLCETTNKYIWKQTSAINPGSFTKYVGAADASITYTGFSNPIWIGFDNRNRLYISDSGLAKILRMKSSGNGLETYVGGGAALAPPSVTQYGSNISLQSPGAFVFDSYNNLIFVDQLQDTVYKVLDADGTVQLVCNYPTNTKVYIESVNQESKLPVIAGATSYNIRSPVGITIDSSNTLYVTSATQIVKLSPNTYRISVYDLDIVAGFGSFLSTISSSVTPVAVARYATLNSPCYIYTATDGIYFLDAQTQQIRKITLEVDTYIPNTTILPYAPVSIIANYSRNTYNSTVTSGEERNALMNKFYAASVCCDTLGNVYVPNSLGQDILKIDGSGNVSVLATSFTVPYGIANYRDEIIYVSDSGKIWPVTIASGARGVVINLAGCQSIAISPVGYLYAASGSTITVYNLKNGGSLVGTIQASGAYSVSSVNCLCVDGDLGLYAGITNGVGAGSEYRVFKYGPITQGQNGYIQPIGSTANLGSKVTGLTVRNGVLYYMSNSVLTTTSPNQNIITVPPSGLPTIAPGTLATGTPLIGIPGIKGQASDGAFGNTTTLFAPLGICIDNNGVIYITDTTPSNTATVLLKNATYTSLQQSLLYNITGANTVGTTTPAMSAYLETFNQIQGVCYDSIGNMYIADSGQNTISKIDLTGTLTTFAGAISTVGGYNGDMSWASTATLRAPTDIKMNSADVLFIADTGNNAIRRVKEYNGFYEIETYISSINSPTALAIDSQDNVYVVTGGSTIAIISPVTETMSTVINAGYPIYAIAVNNNDKLYYTGNGNVKQLDGVVQGISSITNPAGLVIDASNTMYISDPLANMVYSYSGGAQPITLVGNGQAEPPPFSLTGGVAQNIYGNGMPPTSRAFSAPGALAVNSSRGLMIAQATRVSLLPLSAVPNNFICGATAVSSFTITNNGISSIQLSQAVALDSTGTNVILGSISSFTDGFYGCRATGGTSIAAGQAFVVPLPQSATITCILLYLGSLNKSAWNGVTVRVGSSTRYIQGIPESPLAQYTLLDYRTKTSACTPFINYVNKYALQTTAAPPTGEPYRIQYARYIRIVPATSQIILSKIYIIHGETGQILNTGLVPNVSPAYQNIMSGFAGITDLRFLTQSSVPGILIGYAGSITFPSSVPSPAQQPNVWFEYDLGDEYPIEQVILQGITKQYTVTAYTSNRTQISYPSTYNPLDNQIQYARVQGAATNTLAGSGTVLGAPTISANYIEYTTSLTSPSNTVTYTATVATMTSPPPILILYNNSRQELLRSGLTYTGYVTTLQNPTSLAYSLVPIIGLQRVRYIVFKGGSAAATINQILVFDSSKVNVSYGKVATATSVGSASVGAPVSGTDTSPFTFAAADAIRTWTLDLGQEYEVIQIVYFGSAPPPGTTITLLDAFQVQLGTSLSLTMATQSLDLRTSTHFVALPWLSGTSLYVPDTGLRGIIRGRYVRIENPNPTVALSVTTPAIYDTFGKNLVNGKLIVQPAPVSNYGAAWEIDLGQEYSIRDIVYTGSTSPIVIYNRLRAEIWRNYISGSITAPLPLQIALPTATGTSLRFVRLTGACTVNHIAVTDSRGIDVAVWKPVRTVSGSTVAYNTFNGLYNSAIAVTGAAGDRLEIDLGVDYKVASVTVYLSVISAPAMTFYTAAGVIVAGISVTVVTALPTAIQAYTGYGIKTRYVGLILPAAGTIYNLAVIDTLGRNVMGTVRVSSGSVPSFPNSYPISPYSIPTYTEIDLGAEYSITSVVVYTGTTANVSLNNFSVKLMDAYYKTAVTSAQIPVTTYNISYNVGQPWSVPASIYLKSVTITTSTFNTAGTGDTVSDIAINTNNDLYIIKYNGSTTSRNITTIIGGSTTTYSIAVLNNGVSFYLMGIYVKSSNIYLAGKRLSDSSAAIGPMPIVYKILTTNLPTINSGTNAGTTLASFGGGMDYDNCTMIKLDTNNNIFIIKGTTIQFAYSGSSTYTNISGTLTNITALAINSNNIVYVANNNNIWKFSAAFISGSPNPTASIFVGSSSNTAGYTNETGAAAAFNAIKGMCFDTNNNLYVTDSGNNVIRVITQAGLVNTIVPTSGDTTFTSLGSIVCDSTNIIYFVNGINIIKLVIQSSFDEPFVAPVTNRIGGWPTVIEGSSLAYVVDFSPPGLPAFTIGNQTYTTFQITALSADYATGFTYSLNGRAQVTITMPLALPITITPLESYFSIIVYATNGNGSTASAIQYIELAPPVPVVSLVPNSITTNGFAVTWPASPPLDPRYTASYRYTVTGQAAVTTTNTSATVSVPTAGSYPSITVTAIYTYGASVLTSLASAPFSVQLLPAAPTLGAPSAIGSTSFTIGWTAQPAPAAGGYVTTYSYSVNGGTAQTTSGTSVTISTGLIEGSNPGFSLSVIYTKTGSPTLTSATTMTNVQLAPPAPTLNAATSVTTTGFNISWSAAPNAVNAAYTTSYSYTVTGQSAVTTNNTSAAITGITPAGSFPSITVTAIYTYGASVLTTASTPLGVQLIPTATTLNTETNVTSSEFYISCQPVPDAPVAGGYTRSYRWTLVGGGSILSIYPNSGSSSLPEGSYWGVSVSVVYTKSGEPTRTSDTATKYVQLAPKTPTLGTPSNIGVASFTIAWTAQPAPAAGGYVTTYSYSVNGGTAQTTSQTSVTISSGLTAHSNPSFSMSVVYTKTGEPTRTSAAATKNVQLT